MTNEEALDMAIIVGKFLSEAPRPHNVANPQDATGCCAAINRAFRKGELDAVDVWCCPKCSMDWRVRNIEGVRYWEAYPVFVLWR